MRWYSVKWKLPKPNTEVIIMLQSGNVTNAHYEQVIKHGELMSILWQHTEQETVQYYFEYNVLFWTYKPNIESLKKALE